MSQKAENKPNSLVKGQYVNVNKMSDSPPDDTLAVLLAAGAGSRFSGQSHKLLTEMPNSGGITVFEMALENLLQANFRQIIVVTGAASIPDAFLRHQQILVVNNIRWADGQASSVKAGIQEAMRLDAEAVVVGLADQPFVTPQAWRLVASSPSPIAVATYGNKRGNPVRLHKSVWSLLPVSGDSGARDLIRLHPELVSQVDCPGSAADIDTQEDLAQWT